MSGLERDDITRMAQKAGFDKWDSTCLSGKSDLDEKLAVGEYAIGEAVFKFAALVAAAALKNSVMTDEEYEQAMADEGQRRMLEIDTEVRAMIKEAVDAEREACAKVCENIYTGEEACGDWPTPEMCAEAIRARGNDAA